MKMRQIPILAVLAILYFVPGLFFAPGLFDGVLGPCAAAAKEAAASATLTAPDEPGEPLAVRGTVYGADGETPLPGVRLFVYHTDAAGYYSENQGHDSTRPRLHATLVTDAAGQYAFRTILPGRYPSGGIPAHVHYNVDARGYEAQSFELHFAGDPELTAADEARAQRAGRFGSIRPLAKDASGVAQVVYDLRLRE